MIGMLLTGFAVTVACSSSDPTAVGLDTTRAASVAAAVGTVTDANLRPVGGGTVEVLLATARVKLVDVSSGGSYAIPTLAAGAYTVRLHPPLAYSLGPSESGERTLNVVAGESPPVLPFVVQSALYADDFQSYTSSAQITAMCTGRAAAGSFFSGQRLGGNCANPQDIALDRTGGPDGSKAVVYTWPARPTGTSNYTIALQPFFDPAPIAGTTELWLRFTDRLSPNFRIGGAGAVGSGAEYKYLFFDLTMPGFGVGTLQFELDSQQGGPPNSFVQGRFKIINPGGTSTITDGLPGQNGGLDVNLPSDFYGAWNTWVLGVTGLGTPQVTWWTYRNGVLVKSLTGPWFGGSAMPANAVLTIEMGANINNGPDQSQQRWWREFAVYRSRPSLLPLVK